LINLNHKTNTLTQIIECINFNNEDIITINQSITKKYIVT